MIKSFHCFSNGTRSKTVLKLDQVQNRAQVGPGPKTAKQARRIDEKSIEEYGIPSIILMERAGRAVAEEALSYANSLRRVKNRAEVTIFCGKGNNSGDGMVCARYLASAGLVVRVYLLCSKEELKGDAFFNMAALNKRKIRFNEIINRREFNRLKRPLKADIIIDAIFGTGFHGRPDDFYGRVIRGINASPGHKISIDVPSGLDATTGLARGAAVSAGLTLTMGFAKTGFYKNDGPAFCGKIKVVDIGLRR